MLLLGERCADLVGSDGRGELLSLESLSGATALGFLAGRRVEVGPQFDLTVADLDGAPVQLEADGAAGALNRNAGPQTS